MERRTDSVIQLKHSASFSCLPQKQRDRHSGGGARSRTNTLPNDYGFVLTSKHKRSVVTDDDRGRQKKEGSIKEAVRGLLRGDGRKWRSLGALLRQASPPRVSSPPRAHLPPGAVSLLAPPPPPPPQSFYLLDDFLKPRQASNSSSDSLELCSPVPPPVPPPPPPLRLMGYQRKRNINCHCRNCTQQPSIFSNLSPGADHRSKEVLATKGHSNNFQINSSKLRRNASAAMPTKQELPVLKCVGSGAGGGHRGWAPAASKTGHKEEPGGLTASVLPHINNNTTSSNNPPNNTSSNNNNCNNNNSSASIQQQQPPPPSLQPSPTTHPYHWYNEDGRRLPFTSHETLKYYGSRLTDYEKTEIKKYPEVWYFGLKACKIHGEDGASQNGGYDDDNGSYNKVMHDHIAYRYEILEVIGKGSFGQVIRALDYKTNQHIAIKIIRNKKRFHHQALIEVRILEHLRRKDQNSQYNVIHMLDYFYFRNHLCICFELMYMNLYELIKKNHYQGFSLNLIKKFSYSLVQCLVLLYRENIIHCDLKPENVLLKARGSTNIKVIDFGSSCYADQRVYTYIQSRFYRSPEVILGLPYGPPIDMWSLGCILAELYTGYPLFPGENEVEQLACIMEVIGIPPDEIIMKASRKRLFFDSKGLPRCITNSKGRKRKPLSKDLATAIRCNDKLFVDFVSRCLIWDPKWRMTAEDALRHEWLKSMSSSSSSGGEVRRSSSAVHQPIAAAPAKSAYVARPSKTESDPHHLSMSLGSTH